MTKQRAVILEILRADKCHHTAEEIFELAKARLEKISRATVYNNLHSLEKEGLVRRISGENGPDRYDNSYVPHGHLFCEGCGRVYDIMLPDIEKELSESIGAPVFSYELKVRGICQRCKAV